MQIAHHNKKDSGNQAAETQSRSHFDLDRIISSRILTTSQLRSMEADFIKDNDANWGQVLMEIAGRAAAYHVRELYDFYGNIEHYKESHGEIIVLCGKGNNGGDGLVIARYLHLWGLPVTVYLLHEDAKGKEGTDPFSSATAEFKANKRVLESLGVIPQVTTLYNLSLKYASVIVDAIFGTGLVRPVEGIYKDAIEAINESGKTVLSVDVPSGINSDTGQVMGVAIRATRTVTFGALKPGLFCHPAHELAGEIRVVDIGLPLNKRLDSELRLTTVNQVLHDLPERTTNAHKGTFGRLLTIAGSFGMAGAGKLAGESALRNGVGLSILASPKSIAATLPPSEVIYKGLPESKNGSLTPQSIDDLRSEMKKASAIALGPGLSMDKETVEFVHQLLAEIDKPCVIDADALNAIAEKPQYLMESSNPAFVLTPHPKELSRLLGISTSEIQADRIAAARAASSKFDCVVVLKGALTVVASPRKIFINPTGNSGMATAGAGDVLTGIIGALLAQGLNTTQAAVAGVYIHGRAGDLAAQELGQAGVIAGDITRKVPEALKSIEELEPSALEAELTSSDFFW